MLSVDFVNIKWCKISILTSLRLSLVWPLCFLVTSHMCFDLNLWRCPNFWNATSPLTFHLNKISWIREIGSPKWIAVERCAASQIARNWIAVQKLSNLFVFHENMGGILLSEVKSFHPMCRYSISKFFEMQEINTIDYFSYKAVLPLRLLEIEFQF